MTRKIKLSMGSENSSTAISNIFIDEYMPEAHGSYVKVYIYLLRCLGDPSMAFSVSDISDKLDETEKDIVKALKYWEKKKLLSIAWDDDMIAGITINPLGYQVSGEEESESNIIKLTQASQTQPASVKPAETPASAEVSVQSARPKYTASQLTQFRNYPEFDSLLDYIESRTGCVMTLKELQTPAFLYENLSMSPDLIRYLYDYCMYKGKASASYIEKVAINWFEKNIDTVDKARAESFSRSKECQAVRAAFGFSRALGAIELEFVDRWIQQYEMTPDLIREACSRTLLKIGNPDFPYADSILLSWSEAGAKTMDDIAALDEAHRAKSRESRSARNVQSGPNARNGRPVPSNKFTQFPQREHTAEDYSEFERKKLGLV